MGRNGTMIRSPAARSLRKGWLRPPPWPTTAVALVALALAGCSSFGLGQSDPPPIDPNTFPADFKSGVTAFLQANPYGLVGVREASLSAPELKPFGNESRYVACLRATGPNWHKEKMVVYYGG